MQLFRQAVSLSRRDFRRIRTSGFTMMELLVVIAVVAILAALILVSSGSTVRRSRQMQSLVNMKTITAALLAYASENNMRIPSHTGNPDPPTWDSVILPYLGFQHAAGYTAGPVTDGSPYSILQLYRCPLDDRKSGPGFFPRSYAISGVAINPVGGPPPQPAPFSGGRSDRPLGEGISLLEVRTPAAFVLLCRIPKAWEVANNVVGERDKVANNGAPSRNLTDPHWKIFDGRTPYGFLDGHIELCTPSQALVYDPRFWTYDK